jgi:hypothetical protein
MTQQLTTNEARKVADQLFAACKQIRKTLDRDPDPNIISVQLTSMNPTFAMQYAIVIRVMATRSLYNAQAFKNYQAYQAQTSVESIARKTPDFDALDDEARLEAKLQAQAIYNAQYVYLVASEEAKRAYPRTWRENLRTRDLRRKLITEERQQLDANEARSKAAMDEVMAEKEAERQNTREHITTWLHDAAQFGDINAELRRLATPLARNVASLGSTVEEWHMTSPRNYD